ARPASRTAAESDVENNAMMPWEDPSYSDREITDIDTARLAMRGAVASLRSLQDININLKAELQDMLAKEKAWKQHVAEMEGHLTELQARWNATQRTYDEYRKEFATQIRSEVAIEEQEKWEGRLLEIQNTLQEWQKARDLREAELNRIKEL